MPSRFSGYDGARKAPSTIEDEKHTGTSRAYDKAAEMAAAYGGEPSDWLAKARRLIGVEKSSLSIDEAAEKLGGEVDGPYIYCPAPHRPASDRSLCVRLDDDGQPFIYGGSSGGAVAYARKKLGLPPPVTRPATGAIAAILGRAVPAPGTLVERYLRARAITLPVPPTLLFVPLLKHKSGDVFPAMVTERYDAGGNSVALHRTFLQHDGNDRAGIEPGRMDLGPVAGTAIRLSPIADELVIGEGIETTLSVMQAMNKPGWAAGSAMALTQLKLPAAVKKILVVADGDDVGKRAAQIAAARLMEGGRDVHIAYAPDGKDFNDLLQEGQL